MIECRICKEPYPENCPVRVGVMDGSTKTKFLKLDTLCPICMCITWFIGKSILLLRLSTSVCDNCPRAAQCLTTDLMERPKLGIDQSLSLDWSTGTFQPME